MQNKDVALEAKVFLFHLNNSNDENGIHADEGWKICQVNESEKLKIELDYYPTVSAEVNPSLMADFSESVMLNLKSFTKVKLKDGMIQASPGASYLVAFSPTRVRR